MTYPIEPARPGDEVNLQALWKTVFGDPDAYIGAFFKTLYHPERTIVAREGTDIVSAMYLLDCGSLPAPGNPLSCGYLYALATAPKSRGNGAGSAVTQALARLGNDLGFDLCLLSPAEPELVPYYTRLGFRPLSYLATSTITPDPDMSVDNILIMSTDSRNYAILRRPWISADGMDYPANYLAFLEKTLKLNGGGLFAIWKDGATGCAAVEVLGENKIHIKEFLFPLNHQREGIAAFAHHFDAQEILLSYPDQSASAPHTMVFDPDGTINCPENPQIPFVLD